MISMAGVSGGRREAPSIKAIEPSAPSFLGTGEGATGESERVGPVVHIVNRDQEFGRLLVSLFRSAGLETRSYGNCDEFLATPSPDTPACIVLEAEPQLRVSLLDHLKLLQGRIPVLVISRDADVRTAVEAMKAGASDFLQKPLDEQSLLEAVGAAIRADRERRLADATVAELRARFRKLTPRERQVMALVSAGKLNKQVAGELGLSEITIKVHRGSVMRKMGARTIADLVRMADALGLPAT